jgi:hypothetical protein
MGHDGGGGLRSRRELRRAGAVALLGLNAVKNPVVASAWLTAAVGLSAFSQAGFLVNYQEVGPKYAGVLHGKGRIPSH